MNQSEIQNWAKERAQFLLKINIQSCSCLMCLEIVEKALLEACQRQIKIDAEIAGSHKSGLHSEEGACIEKAILSQLKPDMEADVL